MVLISNGNIRSILINPKNHQKYCSFMVLNHHGTVPSSFIVFSARSKSSSIPYKTIRFYSYQRHYSRHVGSRIPRNLVGVYAPNGDSDLGRFFIFVCYRTSALSLPLGSCFFASLPLCLCASLPLSVMPTDSKRWSSNWPRRDARSVNNFCCFLMKII